MKEKQLKDFQTRQTLSDKCIECGSKYVVNKKYKLCGRHNQIRLQMQGEKERENNDDKYEWKTNSSIQWRESRTINRKDRSNKKRKNRTSRKNTFRCSNGEIVTQSEIEKRYKEVCDQIDLERERYCEATGRTDLPLSHSHTISRKRCKDLGKTELIWDKDNLFLESMGASDSGHVTWEQGNLEDKKKLLNFERKLAYIKTHDQETYQKIINEL